MKLPSLTLTARLLGLAALISIVFAVPAARAQGDGSVDTSFDPGSGSNQLVYNLTLQTDGRALPVGGFNQFNGLQRQRIVRLNANGSVDTNFDPNSNQVGNAYSVAVQADGKVVIAGEDMARLNPNGTVDTSFNPGAVARVFTVLAQADGKVVIGGLFNQIQNVGLNNIARLNANGTVDTGFQPGSGANAQVNGAALQTDGKLVIVGNFNQVNGFTRQRIARLNTDGSLDMNFDPGSGANAYVGRVAVQTDGKIIIVGDFIQVNGVTRQRIARLNANGSLDLTFDPGTGANAYVACVAVQTGGKIVIGGDFIQVNGVTRQRVARLNPDGSLDTGFDPGTGANALVRALALQADGNVVIAGDFNQVNGVTRHQVARLNATLPATFSALSPARVWDSRTGPGPTGQVGAGQSRDITVAGVGGVPATGVTAVVLNVAAINPTAQTFATIWPTGETRPLAANLNVPPGDVRANLVVVKVGTGGKVSVFNNAGNADFVADVAGWYGPGAGDRYTPVSPARVWDTRSGPGPTGRIEATGSRNVTVTGLNGVPATGVSAVVLNVAAVNPSARTFLTAWPAGEARPLAANLNIPAGDVRANLVYVKVGMNGQVSFYNNAGDVDVVADVAGYFSATGSLLHIVSPTRIWDTRSGPGPIGQIGAAGSQNLTVTDVGGVPATGATAVVLNIAAIRPSARTFITAWPTGEARPLAANLNVPAGDVRPNLALVKIGAGGQASFYNNTGSVDLVADLAGWYGPPGE